MEYLSILAKKNFCIVLAKDIITPSVGPQFCMIKCFLYLPFFSAFLDICLVQM